MKTHTGHCCRLWKLCWLLSFGMHSLVPSAAHKHLQSDLEHTVNQVETLSCLTGKKPRWEILAVWILCGTLHVLVSWLDILVEVLYFRRFWRNVTSTQTINVLCGSSVSSDPADFFHCVATAFCTDQAEGMTYCEECRNFPSFMLLSAAGTEWCPGLLNIHRNAHIDFGLKLMFQAFHKHKNFYMEKLGKT